MAVAVAYCDSLVADSGISHPTTLSPREQTFIEQVGQHYVRWGIFFGGGDLIRMPDPARPFVFTDAARSVCGHAVVTGALNGQPYASAYDGANHLVEEQPMDRDGEGALAVVRDPRRVGRAMLPLSPDRASNDPEPVGLGPHWVECPHPPTSHSFCPACFDFDYGSSVDPAARIHS